jgi:hypothetical protein
MGERGEQYREFSYLPEHSLATEVQLRSIEDLAAQLGAEETGNMKTISHARRKFTEEELPGQVRRWQVAAEAQTKEALSKDTRNTTRDMRANIGLQLNLLAFALRQGEKEYVRDTLEAINNLLDQDSFKDNRLDDVYPYLDTVLAFTDEIF